MSSLRIVCAVWVLRSLDRVPKASKFDSWSNLDRLSRQLRLTLELTSVKFEFRANLELTSISVHFHAVRVAL